ncbi:hypothetical protein [Candidatus Nesciobacter abundans]|uniref:Uncharacterized protein n=1 Tax=Candidatus Nesciobacter abundans TaxID=2601668 RepID=A0A5C0UHD9_9PROT|nr:hypothetical protein [Candidatus Nesciobacter abundans]QEK39160.1 hypothetical protein FZC36_01790 [Candidatus Nesciobacter abundans]
MKKFYLSLLLISTSACFAMNERPCSRNGGKNIVMSDFVEKRDMGDDFDFSREATGVSFGSRSNTFVDFGEDGKTGVSPAAEYKAFLNEIGVNSRSGKYDLFGFNGPDCDLSDDLMDEMLSSKTGCSLGSESSESKENEECDSRKVVEQKVPTLEL